MGDAIGQGGFGEVFRANYMGMEVAVKRLPMTTANKQTIKVSMCCVLLHYSFFTQLSCDCCE